MPYIPKQLRGFALCGIDFWLKGLLLSGYEACMETGTLFKIETDRVSLTWRSVRDNKTPALKGLTNIPGRLSLRKRRNDLTFHKIYRDSIPETIASDPELETGPLLFEQTDYKLYVNAKSGLPVSVM